MSKTLNTRSFLFVATITILGSIAAQSHAQGWNPVIWDGGQQVKGISYDPFSGRIRVETERNKVRESVTDPNRGYVDPGSYRYVNEYRTDQYGSRWHVRGYQWTSYGVPHGNLSRTRVSSAGGIDHKETENVVFSVPNSGAKSPQQNAKPTTVQKPNWTTLRNAIRQPVKRNVSQGFVNPFLGGSK